MDYTVILHPAEEGGYWVEVPALPGCFSQGETVEEALSNVREAIELHLEGLKEDGVETPQDMGYIIGRVSIAS
ncbi:MAG: type II toxin-antitoxin system HicB family antitoxin [Candidatus Zixiibacteriota bacterium]